MAAIGKSGPLAGLTVIEMAGLGPAPFAALMLAEMGARVVRIERARQAAVAADAAAIRPRPPWPRDPDGRPQAGRRASALVLRLVEHADC